MFSFHTHSLYCDGKASITEFCERAIALGFKYLAFTSHAPVPFENNYALRFEKLIDYRDEVNRAKVAYADKLTVLLGFEADYIPGITVGFDEWRQLLGADFIVGSVHYVIDPLTDKRWFIDGAPQNFIDGMATIFDGDWQRAVSAYFSQVREMVVSQRPDIIGHIDKVKMNNRDVYFKTNHPHYLNEVGLTYKSVKENGGIVEINSRGIYRKKYHECFPHVDGIKQCMELGIPMTLASDSHHPDELSLGLDLSINTAREAGLAVVSVFNNGRWEPIPLESVLYHKIDL